MSQVLLILTIQLTVFFIPQILTTYFLLVFHSGVGSLLWTVAWFAMMYDLPEKHPRISDQEKNYIVKSIGEQRAKDPVSNAEMYVVEKQRTIGLCWAHMP